MKYVIDYLDRQSFKENIGIRKKLKIKLRKLTRIFCLVQESYSKSVGEITEKEAAVLIK